MQLSPCAKSGIHAEKSLCKKKERNFSKSRCSRKKKEKKKFNLDLDLDLFNPSIDIEN